MNPRHMLLPALVLGAVLHSAPGLTRADDVEVLDLTIVGTSIEFDALGLPSRLEGLVYDGDGRLVGTYEEDLTPIIDPVFGFIGTLGVSTFTFPGDDGGTIVTENQSLIVGGDPVTGLLVESQGVVVSGTGEFDNVVGGFVSSSVT